MAHQQTKLLKRHEHFLDLMECGWLLVWHPQLHRLGVSVQKMQFEVTIGIVVRGQPHDL